MKYIFYLWFIIIGTNFASSQKIFEILKNVVNDYDDRIENLDKIISYSLHDFQCIQVIIDETGFSINLLKHLHLSESIRALIVNNADGMTQFCEGYIAVVKYLKTIKELVAFLPMNSENRLVIFLGGNTTKELNQYLKTEKSLFVNADVFLISSNNFSIGYKLGQANKKFIKIEDMSTPWPLITKERMVNFRGRTIRAVTYNCSIFSEIGPFDNITGKPSYENGAEMILFKEIAARLNLTYEIQVPKSFFNKNETALFPTEKWYEEPLKKIEPDGSDVAFCCLLNSVKKRKSPISMSEYIQFICFRFLVPRPKPIQTEWNAIFKPFNTDLWFTLAMVVAVKTFILQRVTILSKQYIDVKGISKYTGLGISFLQLLSILVFSSVPLSTGKQGPSRYLLTSWALFAVIITTAFSSSLASNLTTQLYSPKLDHINDFIRLKFSWLYFKKPDFEEMFNVENKDQARWSVRGKLVKSVTEYNELLKSGKFILWGAQIQKGFLLPYEDLIESKILEGFEVSGECFIQYFSGFAFRVGSTYETAFNKFIQRYKESGLIFKLLNDVNRKRMLKRPYVVEVLELTKTTFAGVKRITVIQLLGIFQIWCAGILISVCVFLLEFCQKFQI